MCDTQKYAIMPEEDLIMLYREYGRTGKKVSLLGFGGMRFANADDRDECTRMMVEAAQGGVNYFDTAPLYCDGKSEAVYGNGFKELRRLGLPFFCSTKTFSSKRDDIRREIDAQLTRLGVDVIDFYHIWCVSRLENWHARKNDGILDTFRELKEEGLVRHICVSSHLIGDEIRELLTEEAFEGVLFGFSAYNFKYREAALKAIGERNLGAVVMNPLGGGVIPRNEELFASIKRPGESITAAALSFIWDHPEITCSIVGFDTFDHVKDALAAMNGYKPRSPTQLAEVKSGTGTTFEGICTGCAYCDDCPAGIPIPKLMDAYNHKIFSDDNKAMEERLKWHWNLDKSAAADCISCGNCEEACTQHLKIIDRLKEIAS